MLFMILLCYLFFPFRHEEPPPVVYITTMNYSTRRLVTSIEFFQGAVLINSHTSAWTFFITVDLKLIDTKNW